MNYKSKQYLDAANLTWIKSRTVVNGRVGVTLGDFSLEVFATNLLNNKNYTSIQQNNLQTPAVPLNQAGATPTSWYNSTTVPSVVAPSLGSGPFSYIVLGLPELRTVGIKGSVKF